jgi:hypothetical protein
VAGSVAHACLGHNCGCLDSTVHAILHQRLGLHALQRTAVMVVPEYTACSTEQTLSEMVMQASNGDSAMRLWQLPARRRNLHARNIVQP